MVKGTFTSLVLTKDAHFPSFQPVYFKGGIQIAHPN